MSAEQAAMLRDAISGLIDARVIEVIPPAFYAHMESVARRRVPRDPNDWPPVALALALDAGILTGDHDFLGCGLGAHKIYRPTVAAALSVKRFPSRM